MSDESILSKTVRPDDEVGKPGPKPVAGGRQTPRQADVTRIEPEGLTDEDRQAGWGDGHAGEDPGMGGSSGGHSDRKPADSPAERKT